MPTLTIAAIASDLNLSPEAVRGYVRTGAIPGGFQPVPHGRWLVDSDAYAEWPAGRRAVADPNRIAPRSARCARPRRAPPPKSVVTLAYFSTVTDTARPPRLGEHALEAAGRVLRSPRTR